MEVHGLVFFFQLLNIFLIYPQDRYKIIEKIDKSQKMLQGGYKGVKQ
jgi:hypothetical protein